MAAFIGPDASTQSVLTQLKWKLLEVFAVEGEVAVSRKKKKKSLFLTFSYWFKKLYLFYEKYFLRILLVYCKKPKPHSDVIVTEICIK